MLMRLVPYGELWDRMHIEDDKGSWSSGLPEDHAKFYAMSIADTLNFIHSRGVIYRDLKPENVLIDVDGYPVIVDFGFAKFCSDKTYTFVGTPNYVAPEIITNAGHNRSVDFWAFGVTVYEMVTGENPFFFEGMDSVSLYHTICHDKHFSLSGESEEFVDLIDKLLKKNPIERFGMLHGGGCDIIQHNWFDGLELAQIRSKSFPAPWKPTLLIRDGFEDLRLKEGKRTLTQDDDSYISVNDSGSFPVNVPHEEIEKVIQRLISPDSRPIEVGETSAHSYSEDIQECNLSKSSETKKKKKSPKSDATELDLNKPKSNRHGSIKKCCDDSPEFQLVTLKEVDRAVRNPTIRRTLSQKKRSRNRRDLLKTSFKNLGIDIKTPPRPITIRSPDLPLSESPCVCNNR